MIRLFLAATALGALAACAPPPAPNSGTGVGFDRVDADRAARDAALRGAPVNSATLPAAPAVTGVPLDATAGAVAASPGVSTGTTAAVTNAAGISQEQDFDAVSGQRGIEDDAARIAAARAQYQVIEPGALPTRPGTDVPNIVEYALRTDNPRGLQIYPRSNLMPGSRTQRNCGDFASPDLAQEAFLSDGGPQRDRRGLDPDGDGFACDWDPTPFRRAVAPAPNPAPNPEAGQAPAPILLDPAIIPDG